MLNANKFGRKNQIDSFLQIEGLNWQKLNLENQFYNGCKNQGTKLIFFPKDSYFCYKKEKEKKSTTYMNEKRNVEKLEGLL